MHSNRKTLAARKAIELTASLLESGSVKTRGDAEFTEHHKLFIGAAHSPALGLYLDRSAACLRALPFACEGPDLIMIPFNFDQDPPFSQAAKVSRGHMLVLAGALRGGQLKNFRKALIAFTIASAPALAA